MIELTRESDGSSIWVRATSIISYEGTMHRTTCTLVRLDGMHTILVTETPAEIAALLP